MTTAPGAFIFDMDGTIVDNMGWHAHVWVDMLADEGLIITPEEFNRQTAGKTNPVLLRQMLGELSDEQVAAFAERKEVRYRELFRPHLKAIAGLIPFVERARALSIPLALATSAGRANIAYILAGIGAETLFDAVVSGEELTHSKPHPEIFLTAAAKLGVPPARCLAFEDALAGIESARRAGMPVVVITTTISATEALGLAGVVQAQADFTALDPATLQLATE
ncbi:MAG: beta-phosphoglucomutase family hydrolase [Chloroflexales bacterium]|nr:beta-phosphoglucomutase family hydrolase [Chloroflexales bacterium]